MKETKEIFSHELNHFGCKTYLFTCEGTGKAVLIDPVVDRVDRYLAFLAYHRLTLELTVDTHTHPIISRACGTCASLQAQKS